MGLRVRRLSADVEKDIITGLIVSTPFCEEVSRMFNPKYFAVSYMRRVAVWCINYFNEFKEAPNEEIETIYKVEKEELDRTERATVETFLQSLSERYEDKKSFNVNYLVRRTKEYFRKRGCEVLFDEGKELLNIGRVDEAEEVIKGFRDTVRETSEIVNPFDPDVVRSFRREDDADNPDVLFSFEDKVGDLVGNLQRGWFVSFMGPMKRGKTWWLMETAFQAMHNNLRVLMFSFEMNRTTMLSRIYKRMTGYGEDRKGVLCPVFDCFNNQIGDCNKRERENRVQLIGDNVLEDLEDDMDWCDIEILPEYGKVNRYKPCTYCRTSSPKDYIPAVWFEKKKFPSLTQKNIQKKINIARKVEGDNLRIKVFPAYSATVSDILYEIDNLEYSEGFIPDVVITDYADIVAPENRRLSERGSLDDVWKAHKQLAASRHCLVVSASQSNRKSMEMATVTQVHTAEDIRKLAHVDVMISINQRPIEKENNIIRLGLVAHRHRKFDQLKQVRVLQLLERGQVMIDSEWYGGSIR